MTVFPVIVRELRSQARQSFTYTLRVYGVAALLATMVFLMFGDNFGAGSGAELFVNLHRVVLGSIWILIPLGAADCLSRERREGTLGLLFLTPLKPRDIIIAKAGAHVFRALTLWLASLPVLMLPLLVGGVTWEYVLFSCLLNFWSISFVVGVSVVASALCQRATRAVGLTVILGGALSVLMAYVLCLLIALAFFLITDFFAPTMLRGRPNDWSEDWFDLAQSPGECLSGFTVCILGNEDVWSAVTQMPSPVMKNSFLAAWGIGVAFAFGVSLLLLWLAAKIVRRRWQDSVRSPRAEKLERAFCKPVVAPGLLKRWLRRRLDKNPIGWLEQRSWSGRMVTWAWFAIIISVYSAVLTDRNFFRGGGEIQMLIGWSLAISMAVSATGSFRRERESGVLELLLVSPLTTRQIINGRLRGLWGQFLPAVVALLGIWAYFISIFGNRVYSPYMDELVQVLFFGVSFLVIPVVGLYFSVQCRHFITALLLTLGSVFVVPLLLTLTVGFLQWGLGAESVYFDWNANLTGQLCFFQLMIAWFLLRRLHHKLEHRSFPLERPAG
ncbi:MAG: hypothetical protein AAB370_09855 [Verrucomicrobiota bacterium]